MAKQIIWSNHAQNDRKAIFKYWNNRNKSNTYSKKLNQLFNAMAELISKYPGLGKQTDVTGVKTKIIKEYYFTFRETENAIEVLTIWDCRQDTEKFKKIFKE
jgi:plasmid stabilization system protein ParE